MTPTLYRYRFKPLTRDQLREFILSIGFEPATHAPDFMYNEGRTHRYVLLQDGLRFEQKTRDGKWYTVRQALLSRLAISNGKLIGMTVWEIH